MAISKTANPTNEISADVYQKFKTFNELCDLPLDLRISTITMTCKLDTDFLLENIGRYISLSPDRIVAVKYGSDPNCNRSLIEKKSRSKKNKKKKRTFFNQATVIIKARDGKTINLKLFLNGSIQMTGCKNLRGCIDVLDILCNELKIIKGVLEVTPEYKIIPKVLVTDSDAVDISKIKNILIRMINSGFYIGFEINREKLYEILLRENIDCIFEPIVHACVNIKYNYKNLERISIFVFETGNIIITGAKTKDQIIEAYKFITKKIYKNYNKIVINNLDKLIEEDSIKQILAESNISI